MFYSLLHEVNFVKQQPSWKVFLGYWREELRKMEKLRYYHLLNPSKNRFFFFFFFSPTLWSQQFLHLNQLYTTVCGNDDVFRAQSVKHMNSLFFNMLPENVSCSCTKQNVQNSMIKNSQCFWAFRFFLDSLLFKAKETIKTCEFWPLRWHRPEDSV